MTAKNPYRAIVYDPYLATLGGGERYAFSVASVLALNADVTVAGPIIPSKTSLEARGLPTQLNLLTMDDRAFVGLS